MSRREHTNFAFEKSLQPQVFKANNGAYNQEEPELDQRLPLIIQSPYLNQTQRRQFVQGSSIQNQLNNSSRRGLGYPYYDASSSSMQLNPQGSMQRSPFKPHLTPFQPSKLLVPSAQGSQSLNSIRMSNSNPKNSNTLYKSIHNLSQQNPMSLDKIHPDMMHWNPLQQNMMFTNVLRTQMTVQAFQQRILNKVREQQRRQQEEESVGKAEVFDIMAKNLENNTGILHEIATSIRKSSNIAQVKRKPKAEKESTKPQIIKPMSQKKNEFLNKGKHKPKQLKSSSDETEDSSHNQDLQKTSRLAREAKRMNTEGSSSQQTPMKRISAFAENLDHDIEGHAQRIKLPSRKKYPASLDTLTPTSVPKKTQYPSQEYYAVGSSSLYNSKYEIDEIDSLLSNSDLEASFNNTEREKYPSIHGDLLDDKSGPEEAEYQPKNVSQAQPNSATLEGRLFDFSRKKSGKNIQPLSLPSLTKLEKDEEQLSNRSGGFAVKNLSRSTIFDEIKSKNNHEPIKQRTLILPPLNLSLIKKEAPIQITEQNDNHEETDQLPLKNNEIKNKKGAQNDSQPELNTLVFTETNRDPTTQASEPVFGEAAEKENKYQDTQETEKQAEKPGLFNLKPKNRKPKKGRKRSTTLKKEKASKGPQRSSNSRFLIPQDEELKKIWHMFPVADQIEPIQVIKKTRASRRPVQDTEEALPEVAEEIKQIIEPQETETIEEKVIPEIILFDQEETPADAIEDNKPKEASEQYEIPKEELPSLQEPTSEDRIKSINLENKAQANATQISLLPEQNPSNNPNSKPDTANSGNKNIRLAQNSPRRGLFSYMKNDRIKHQ